MEDEIYRGINLVEEKFSKVEESSRIGVWKVVSILCTSWFWVSTPDFHLLSSYNNDKKEENEEKDVNIVQQV